VSPCPHSLLFAITNPICHPNSSPIPRKDNRTTGKQDNRENPGKSKRNCPEFQFEGLKRGIEQKVIKATKGERESEAGKIVSFISGN
jgi:hypothetical protein